MPKRAMTAVPKGAATTVASTVAILSPTVTRPPGALGEGAFTVDAALLFQLGEELVNRRSVALSELIKNAYDADATLVTVRLMDLSAPGGTIEIVDNGSGLSFMALTTSWLRIATSTKVEEPVSPGLHRSRAGAKGVGRFAARRLASKLVVDSIAKSEDDSGRLEHVWAEFDWARFKPGLRIEDVKIPLGREFLSRERRAAPPRTGLTLVLSGVKDAWTEDDVQTLHTDLLRLVGPARSSTDEFNVVLEAPEFPLFAGDLADRFLDYGLARLHGELGTDGSASYELKFRNEKKKRFSPKATEFPGVGPASFDVALFVYKSTFFAGLPIKTRDAQERGREQGGVHIYVDRFRVPPYGDQGDDWLGLDEARGRRLDATPAPLTKESEDIPGRPMLLLPGNNQLFGSVHLSRPKNPALRQTVNRERFIENAAFNQLRHFVRLGIDWMTVQYAARMAAAREAARNPEPEELLQRARTKFVETIEHSALADEERTEVVQAFDLAMHAIQARQEELISELSMLRVLASTGTMIAVFEHQLMASLSGLNDLAKRVQRLVRQAPDATREKLEGETGALKSWISDLQRQADLIGLLLAKEARSRRRRVPVNEAVQRVADSFASFMRETGIEFVNRVPVTLKTPSLYPAELTAVLLNLFTNALKAVQHVRSRRIEASAEREDGQVYVRLSDTGVGADPERWEEFFLPFTTTSNPDPLLGHGTGLGLKIVRDIASVYGGTARFVAPSDPWRTTLEVALPET
jgi:signal transduction histidine kinase